MILFLQYLSDNRISSSPVFRHMAVCGERVWVPPKPCLPQKVSEVLGSHRGARPIDPSRETHTLSSSRVTLVSGPRNCRGYIQRRGLGRLGQLSHVGLALCAVAWRPGPPHPRGCTCRASSQPRRHLLCLLGLHFLLLGRLHVRSAQSGPGSHFMIGSLLSLSDVSVRWYSPSVITLSS